MKSTMLLVAAALALPVVATAQRPARRVNVQKPIAQLIERKVEAVGTALPLQSAILRPRVSGYLKEMFCDPGDILEAGAIVARIDVPELEAKKQILEALVVESEAHIADAESGVARAEAAVRVARADVGMAEAEVGAHEATVTMHEVVLARRELMLERGAATQEEIDEARGAVDLARANLGSARSRVGAAEARVTAREVEVSAARSGVVSARAHLESARRTLEGHEVQLSFASLTNPYERGLVTKRSMDPGALVQAAMSSIVTLMDVSSVRVQLDIPERESALVMAGTPVRLVFDALPGRPVATKVTRSFGALDAMSRTMRCEIVLENSEGLYKPGMFCHATLEAARHENALTVPGSAIYSESSGGLYCMIAVDGKAKAQPVEVGVDDGRLVEILSGLERDHSVILGRPPGLGDGDPIEAVETSKP